MNGGIFWSGGYRFYVKKSRTEPVSGGKAEILKIEDKLWTGNEGEVITSQKLGRRAKGKKRC